MFLTSYKKAFDVIMRKPFVLWGLSLMSVLISSIIFFICGLIPAVAVFFSYLIGAGMSRIYLDGLKGRAVSSDQLFSAFSSKAGRIAGALAWKDLWIIIWALIPIVGPFFAIYKSYSYRFVSYIVMTRPEVTATQALKLSMQMTNGKKLNMFLADICFNVGTFFVFFFLGLFAGIPFINILFMPILFVAYIIYFALAPIFTGLYQASFYEEY